MEQLKCGCGELLFEESHEIKGEVMCFNCYEWEMDEILFGDPYGEW